MYMLNRVLSESDIDYDDVRYHIMFEIAMETHIVMTPTSISSWGTCLVIISNKMQVEKFTST